MDGQDFVVGVPRADLRPMVERYVGYRQRDVTLGVHRGLPSRAVTMVISLAEPIRIVGGPGAEHGPLATHVAIGGLHLSPALIRQDAYQEGIHLYLNPLGVRRLLGVSATDLSSTTCDAADLSVPWRRDLVDRLRAVPDWSARFAILDAELSRGTDRPVTLFSEVQWAWQRMIADGGTARVGQLAEEVGWSRRHFGQRFADAVGVTPKQAVRLMRFERSGALLRAAYPRSLAELAVDCGYYDQAHLTHEWQEFAGCTPGTWIAEELPFLQEPADPAGADSVS